MEEPSKQEKKQLEAKTKQGNELLLSMENLCQSILENPSKWLSPQIQFLRDFFKVVSENPNKFPPALPDSVAVHHHHDSTDAVVSDDEEKPSLMKGFATGLANGSIFSTSDCRNPPLLQVVRVQSKFKMVKDPSTGENVHVKKTALTAVDGDGTFMLVQIASQLTEFCHQLQVGTVFKATQFQALHYTPSDNCDTVCVAVMLCNFTVVSESTRLLAEPGPDDQLSIEVLSDAAKESVANESPAGDDGAARETNARSAGKSQSPFEPVPKAPPCTDQNRLCAIAGNVRDICICDSFPPESFALRELAKDCHFVTEETDRMPPSHKRNVMYWWYATNPYNIRGAGNVIELPPCLVQRVRQLYPNPRGQPYVGNRGPSAKFLRRQKRRRNSDES